MSPWIRLLLSFWTEYFPTREQMISTFYIVVLSASILRFLRRNNKINYHTFQLPLVFLQAQSWLCFAGFCNPVQYVPIEKKSSPAILTWRCSQSKESGVLTLVYHSSPEKGRGERKDFPPPWTQYLLIPKIRTPCSWGNLGIKTLIKEMVLMMKCTRSYFV